jgi:hypothetical protein
MIESICDSIQEKITKVDQYESFKIFLTCKLLEQLTNV